MAKGPSSGTVSFADLNDVAPLCVFFQACVFGLYLRAHFNDSKKLDCAQGFFARLDSKPDGSQELMRWKCGWEVHASPVGSVQMYIGQIARYPAIWEIVVTGTGLQEYTLYMIHGLNRLGVMLIAHTSISLAGKVYTEIQL